MKVCIFDDYFIKGKVCFMEYNCDHCSVREEVKKTVLAVAQSNKPSKQQPVDSVKR